MALHCSGCGARRPKALERARIKALETDARLERKILLRDRRLDSFPKSLWWQNVDASRFPWIR